MKLTEKKGNKYFALARVEEIVQKLNRIEHEAPALLSHICDGYCMYPQVLNVRNALGEMCESCPMKELMEIIQ